MDVHSALVCVVWQAMFVVAMVLAYVALYLPTIRALDRVMKASRATLIMFPEEIVNSVAPIRNLMKQFSRAKAGK